jgi:hypothetical protein
VAPILTFTRRRISALTLALAALAIAIAGAQGQERRKLLVLSVDGLDWRYLRDADRLGVKIPTFRRLMAEGESADGVLGAVPTVTWPSHTTLITGVEPRRHGILGNQRPRDAGGDYYWSAHLLKVDTLWHATRRAGLTSAAITWPVTVDADIDWNLPELFAKRRGGAMDLPSIASKATPGLVERITAMYPSFPQEWMDDRTRALATMYLMRERRPDLTLVHFVDLDAEAHDNGPFTREANAMLEYTDELVGRILAVLPANVVVALVSDHGFERTDRVINVPVLLTRLGVTSGVDVGAGLLLTVDEQIAATLRKARLDPANGIGREVPLDELRRIDPSRDRVVAAFEPAESAMFGQDPSSSAITLPAREKGGHYGWPGRPGYRATFVIWGPDIRPARTPELRMTEVASRLAAVLGVPFTPGMAAVSRPPAR